MALPVSTLVVFTVTIALYHFILRPAVFSPLAKIPSAHWSVPFSSLWILRARHNNMENRLLHEAHQRLGPVVRTGPAQISIDGADNVKTVYQGGFNKDTWYSVFDNYGVPCMFSARTSAEHTARKRMIAHVYSKSYLQSSPVAKAQGRVILFERLLPLLAASVDPKYKPHGIDVQSIFLATTMDFISAYVYGIGHETSLILNKGYRDHWLELYNSRNNHHFWPQELPRLTRFLQKIGLWLYPHWVDYANQELSDWNMRLTEDALTYLSIQPSPNVSAGEPVVVRALNAGMLKELAAKGGDSALYPTSLERRRLSIASECFDHVLAGQETAGVCLTYLTWQLSKPESKPYQAKLRQELLSLSPCPRLANSQGGDLPDPKQLDSLPLLDAIIMETLRLHAPLPGAQARRTPYPECVIGDFRVPGGVRVSAAAHWLHRDESVFPESLLWDPTRWHDAELTDVEQRQRRRQFWAFGSGGRMCIGSNFAMQEMKQIVAAIYINFTTHIVDDKGMEQTDGYAGRPMNDRLILRFEHVKD